MKGPLGIPASSLAAMVLGFILLKLSAADEPIDWDKARQLHQRAQQGEKLAPDEQACYDRARAFRSQREGRPNATPAAPAPWTHQLTPQLAPQRNLRRRQGRATSAQLLQNGPDGASLVHPQCSANKVRVTILHFRSAPRPKPVRTRRSNVLPALAASRFAIELKRPCTTCSVAIISGASVVTPISTPASVWLLSSPDRQFPERNCALVFETSVSLGSVNSNIFCL